MEQKWKVQALPSSKITAPAWKKYNSYGKGTTSPEHHKYVTSVVSPVSLTTAQLPSLIAITELLKKSAFLLNQKLRSVECSIGPTAALNYRLHGSASTVEMITSNGKTEI